MGLMKCCGMASRRMGKLGVSVRKKKALAVRMGDFDTDSQM
jgi:hypothetical protein